MPFLMQQMEFALRFYPRQKKPPESLTTSEFILRPLLVDHVDLDYEAVMEDPAYLRSWGQGGWPSDDFTLGENLLDLERHQREHSERSAFTFTVLSHSEESCFGCVYITPIGVRIPASEIPPQHRPEKQQHTGDVCFWIRPSLQTNKLDSRLLAALLQWLRSDWYFDRIFFHTSAADARQQELFDRAGLDQIARFSTAEPRPGTWLLYQAK